MSGGYYDRLGEIGMCIAHQSSFLPFRHSLQALYFGSRGMNYQDLKTVTFLVGGAE
jgi:hypothetical protein